MHTFPMSSHDRVFNIDYTLGSGCTPSVSILDSECVEAATVFQNFEILDPPFNSYLA